MLTSGSIADRLAPDEPTYTETSSLDRPTDDRDSPGGYSGHAGFRFNATSNFDGLRLTLSADTMDVYTAEVLNPDGTVVNSVTWDSPKNAGDQFDLMANIVSGNTYHVVVGPQSGGSYSRGAKSFSDAEFQNYSTADFNVTHGVFSSTSTTFNWWYTITRVGALVE